jgi:integrase
LVESGQNIVENRTGGRSAPTTVNSSVRTREYLTTAEIERLMAAARKSSRYGHRDATMILIGYRHGLRASELCDLQWSQVELATGRLHVRRAKNGSPTVHPMQGAPPARRGDAVISLIVPLFVGWLLLKWLLPRLREPLYVVEPPPPQIILHVHLIVPVKEQPAHVEVAR